MFLSSESKELFIINSFKLRNDTIIITKIQTVTCPKVVSNLNPVWFDMSATKTLSYIIVWNIIFNYYDILSNN